MGTATSANLFWSFVRYITNGKHQSIETMTKKDFIKFATAFATVNTAELGTYDDGLATVATPYTDVQLPGITGADFDAAITLATKKAIFDRAVYPGQDSKVADVSVTTILPRYDL